MQKLVKNISDKRMTSERNEQKELKYYRNRIFNIIKRSAMMMICKNKKKKQNFAIRVFLSACDQRLSLAFFDRQSLITLRIINSYR